MLKIAVTGILHPLYYGSQFLESSSMSYEYFAVSSATKAGAAQLNTAQLRTSATLRTYKVLYRSWLL